MSGILSTITGMFRPKRRLPSRVRERIIKRGREIIATYDAAQYTDENTKHWLNADDLSAKAANTAEVRATLRRRARYERDNNSYLKGMVKTFANEIVATGPRLQLQTSNEKANHAIEQAFGDWMRVAQIPAKLALFVETRLIDGELFGVFSTNPTLSGPVKLDVRLIEADQVTTPAPEFGEKNAVDGIHFDANGNPRFYDVLKQHPGGEGEFSSWFWTFDVRQVKAENMLHYFRVERAGQARGIPDVTPALNLFAQLRRYTLAVLMAAELAASFAAIIKTDLPVGEAADQAVAWETIDIVRGMMQTLPSGAEMQQFRPEQPVTTFAEFVRCLLREISRCFEMPFAVATGDNSDNSYAGGRLEVQSWERKVICERSRSLEPQLLERIFPVWLAEASRIEGYLPLADLGPPEFWRHKWLWDGFKHVDPMKESRADDVALRNGSRSLTDICGERGKDLQEHIAELKSAKELFEAAGLAYPLAMPPAPPVIDPQQLQDQQDQQDNADSQGVADAVPA